MLTPLEHTDSSTKQALNRKHKANIWHHEWMGTIPKKMKMYIQGTILVTFLYTQVSHLPTIRHQWTWCDIRYTKKHWKQKKPNVNDWHNEWMSGPKKPECMSENIRKYAQILLAQLTFTLKHCKAKVYRAMDTHMSTTGQSGNVGIDYQPSICWITLLLYISLFFLLSQITRPNMYHLWICKNASMHIRTHLKGWWTVSSWIQVRPGYPIIFPFAKNEMPVSFSQNTKKKTFPEKLKWFKWFKCPLLA